MGGGWTLGVRELGSFRIIGVAVGGNWAIGLYIVDCRMYIGCWKLGSPARSRRVGINFD